MPFEVFNWLYRCSGIHGAHPNLEDATSCFAEITRRYNGEIPIHPISQKYTHAIAAVDGKGNQRNFSTAEKLKAEQLNLDPKSLMTEMSGITTFAHIAKMYHEASKLIPIPAINLEGILDYKNKDRHFWSTDAGMGQALAYAQQAAFTLELSLKANLEVLGKLAEENDKQGPNWRTHDLIKLFNLLTEDEKQPLERWWSFSDTKRNHFDGTLHEFLSSSNNLYAKWRYIPDLKSASFSMDIQALVSASSFLIESSARLFREHWPIKVEGTTEILRNPDKSRGHPAPPPRPMFIEGVVRSVKIPEGFDPYSTVEVVIDSDHHEHFVTTSFYKRNVESYYGLEGKSVQLYGYSSDAHPYLLENPQHEDRMNGPDQEPDYTFEHRPLRGSVYNLTASQAPYGLKKTNLVLSDKTFFTQVECLFSTDEERKKLTGVKLGDEILISGHVTLLNGKPIVLVGPDLVEQVTEDNNF